MKWPRDATLWTWTNKSIQVGPTVNLAVKVASQNLNRAYILFQDDTGGVLIGDSNVNSFGPFMFDLFQIQYYKEFTYSEHGPLCWKEWWACRGSGSSHLQVTEVTYVGTEQLDI